MESESYIEGFKVHGLLGEGGQAKYIVLYF